MKVPSGLKAILIGGATLLLLPSGAYPQVPSPPWKQETATWKPDVPRAIMTASKTVLGAFRDLVNLKGPLLSPEQLKECQDSITQLEALAKKEIPPGPETNWPADVYPELKELHHLARRFREINAPLPVTTIDVVNAARFWNLDRGERMQPDKISAAEIEKLVQGGYLSRRPDLWDELRQSAEPEDQE